MKVFLMERVSLDTEIVFRGSTDLAAGNLLRPRTFRDLTRFGVEPQKTLESPNKQHGKRRS